MLKKTVHRPNYRERAQPREREKWGVLEKHKASSHPWIGYSNHESLTLETGLLVTSSRLQ